MKNRRSRSLLLASLLLAPAAQAQLQNGDLLVNGFSCVGNSVVAAFRPDGTPVMQTQGGTGDCWEGALSLPGGVIGTAPRSPSRIDLFDAVGVEITTFLAPKVVATGDLDAFADGTLVLADLAGTVELYTQAGAHVRTLSQSLTTPWGVHVDDQDVLWVCDRWTKAKNDGAIVRFDHDGNWLGTIQLPYECNDLVVAPDGTLWTIGYYTGDAYHFAADGTLLSSFNAFQIFSGGLGVALLPDGTLAFTASDDEVRRFDVNGTLLNSFKMPSVPFPLFLNVVTDLNWKDAGHSLAGTAGLPSLTGEGSLLPGATTYLSLSNTVTNGASILVAGTQRLDLPLYGGVLVPAPTVLLQPIPTGPTGSWTLAGPWPPGMPSATTLWFQAWIPDAAALHGYAASNALEAVTP